MSSTSLKFNVTIPSGTRRIEYTQISAICKLIMDYIHTLGHGFDHIKMVDLSTSLTQCHEACVPLDLDAMLDPKNFTSTCHDVLGINRHMKRSTGQLGGNFMPRLAKKPITTRVQP